MTQLLAKAVAVEALSQGVAKVKISPPVIKENAIVIPKQPAFTAVKRVQVPLSHNPHPPAAQSNPHPPSNPHPAATPANPQHPAGDDYVVTPDTYRDWIANVTLEKYALKGSGRVCFFIGPTEEIPANPSDWFTSPIYVGAYTIFATNPETTGCENCKDQADSHQRVGGTVHLTKTLIRRHCPLTGDAPINYLKENLHWRLCNAKEEEVRREDVPSLKVVVQSAGFDTTPNDGSQIIGRRPQRSPWERHSPITAGRPGGVEHGDEFNS